MSDEPVIHPRREDSFFIGWEASSPPVDRRFLLGAALALVGAGGGAAAFLANAQQGPGDGSWPQGDVRDWPGVLRLNPYPMLQLAGADAPSQHALLFCGTKCGVQQRLEQMGEGPLVVRGSPLQRGRNRAIAVADGPDWITPVSDGSVTVRPVTTRALGPVDLTGEILDSKCWFGAMRPGDGKTHKACAALCIRFGVPPAFYAQDGEGRAHALVMTTPDGAPLGDDILPLVADRVRASGELHLIGDDLLTLRVDPSAIIRV